MESGLADIVRDDLGTLAPTSGTSHPAYRFNRVLVTEVEHFFRVGPMKGMPEADRFDLLTLLIEVYE